MASGFKDFGMTFGSRISMLILSLGTQSSLAWILGPSGRGAYAVCLLFSSILGLIFIIGCDYAGIYYVAAKKLSISEGVFYTFIFGGIGSLLAIAAGKIIMTMPLPFLGKATTGEFNLALIFIPVSVFSYTFLMLLTAYQKFNWFSILSILSAFLRTLRIIYIKFGLQWEKISFSKMRDMLLYDARHYIGKLSNQINLEVGTIILAMFASQAEIGLFAVAVSLTTRLNMIPNTLETVLIPRVAADERGKRQLIAQTARLTGALCGSMLLILAVFANIIVAILFSPAFLPAVELIRILAAGVTIRCASKVLVTYLLGTNHPGIISVSVGVGMAINLGILWFFLPVFGLAAAAWAMTISFVVSSGIIAASFSKRSGMRLMDIFVFRFADWNLVTNSLSSLTGKMAFLMRK
ncbi:MAG: polysaccharide biosynthesis C-terminal domain-containing protein [Calditrichia bacterium]